MCHLPIYRSLTPPPPRPFQEQVLVASLGSANADDFTGETQESNVDEEFECASVASFPIRNNIRPTTC